MKRLTETDEHGNWSLKGLPWEGLNICLPIAPESYKAICEAICQLKNYEDTGLSPAEVEALNTIKKKQVSHLMEALIEERNKYKWIPTEEKLPESDEVVLITVSGVYNNLTFQRAVQLGSYDDSDGWIVEGYEEWYDSNVTAWMPLPEPYGEKK